MNKLLIIANWKCNPTTLKEAKLLFNAVGKGLKDINNVEVVICPPFLYIAKIQNTTCPLARRGYKMQIGGQSCFWEEKGAFTGEISAKMLKNLGCDYVILGHSERRKYFGESDEMINKKIKAALATKLRPILCVGETAEERKKGKTFKVLEKQLKTSLKNTKYNLPTGEAGIQDTKYLVVAYEPIWAIGTGNACQTSDAKKAAKVLRKVISRIFSGSFAKKIRILYGGSVNSKNAAGYLKEAGFQGLLVGGASLDSREFLEIVKKSSRTCPVVEFGQIPFTK